MIRFQNKIEKVGEATYSEVFSVGNSVLKVIPFGGENQSTIQEALNEGRILKSVQSIRGFVRFHSAKVTIGTYPLVLLKAWDNYKGKRENEKPSK